MVPYPLTKANRLRLAQAFRHAPRVDLSIDCVIEGQMGEAFADDEPAPAAYAIRTGPFVYFAGDAQGEGAPVHLAELLPGALMMPSAPGWREAAAAAFGGRLAGFDRYCVSSAALSPGHLADLPAAPKHSPHISAMDLAFARAHWGRDHFVDLSLYDSAEDFIERGVGFAIEKRGRVAGAAFASLVCSRGIEISIYVERDYRRQGIATALAARLLGWCLERGFEPHWDAANLPSLRLAEKLGYTPTGSYRAHYLED